MPRLRFGRWRQRGERRVQHRHHPAVRHARAKSARSSTRADEQNRHYRTRERSAAAGLLSRTLVQLRGWVCLRCRFDATGLRCTVTTRLDVETCRTAVMRLLGVHLRAAVRAWEIEGHRVILRARPIDRSEARRHMRRRRMRALPTATTVTARVVRPASPRRSSRAKDRTFRRRCG